MLNFLSAFKARLLAEAIQLQGFMQLLMKPRNGIPWSPADRAALRVHVKRLARLVPGLLIFSLPGGGFLLPFLAWYLDRRRLRR